MAIEPPPPASEPAPGAAPPAPPAPPAPAAPKVHVAGHLRLESKLFEKLKARNIVRVAVLYLVVCWLILEPVHVIFHMLEVPAWANRLVVILMAVGFPAVLLFAWAFEVTPQGLKPSAEVAPERSIARNTGRRLDRAIIVVLAVALGYFVFDKLWLSKHLPAAPAALATEAGAERPAPTAPAAASSIPDRSVAVLPFINMSSDKEQEYFSDGLAEELIDLLAKLPDLRVTARTSSFSFKGKAVTVGEIGQVLKVANVLEGSVRKVGHTVRITAQLVRADNGYHLWSETYDRDLKDVFAVQDDIARVVVDKLKVTLLTAAPTSDKNANPEAHNLLLQGRYFSERETAADFVKAIDALTRALALDPGYAPAWAELGWASFRQYANGYRPVDASLSAGRVAAEKAMALDPRLADGYVVAAQVRMVWDRDWPGAGALLATALKLEPLNSRAMLMQTILTYAGGNQKDAIRLYERVLERDPLNLLARRYLARMLYFVGRLDDAETTIREVLALNGSYQAANYELGRILLARGQVAAAVTAFEAETDPGWRQFGLPLGYHAQHREPEAKAALAALVANSAGSEFQVAETYGYFGDADRAFEWLDRAVERHDGGLLWLRGDPLLKGITHDRRYPPLLARLHYPAP